MTAIGTLPVLFATGNHASRPAASAVGKGGLYSCTTHGLVYQTDGSSWTTWATLGAAASGSITASGYTQTTARLLGRTTASTGAIEEITVGSGLSLSAGSLTATGGSSLTSGEAVLSGDVTMVNGFGTTVYDATGCSVSLGAGTYVVNFQVLFVVIVATSQSYEWFTKLWDGTNIFGQAYVAAPATQNYNGYGFQAVGTARFTLGSTQTVKLTSGSTRGSSGSKMARDDGTFGLTSHMGTKFSYVQVA